MLSAAIQGSYRWYRRSHPSIVEAVETYNPRREFVGCGMVRTPNIPAYIHYLCRCPMSRHSTVHANREMPEHNK